MPNHVTNILTLSGDENQINELLERIKNDKFGIGTISFNKIIPMPESLNIEAGSCENNSISIYLSAINPINEDYPGVEKIKADEFAELFNCIKKSVRFSPEILLPLNEAKGKVLSNKGIEDMMDMGRKYVNNLLEYSAATWYDWRIDNWGTKWDAYGYMDDFEYDGSGNLEFCTAWSAPHKVIEKLSEMFPDIEIEHKWADEDIGYNCGRYTYENGELIGEYFPESEDDSIIFASEVMGLDPAEFGIDVQEDCMGMEEN